jgi:hypothetical protein
MARGEQRLAAFAPEQRALVRQFASRCQALEDLAESFPALLFALATGYATAAQRERATRIVCRGEPLRQAAEALGLAWWLRKLPPQAFIAPLTPLPDDDDFQLRIASLLPRDPGLAAAWLQRVAHASAAAGAAYALWIARHADVGDAPQECLLFMAAWAWFSGQPGLLGHRVLRRPWNGEMSFKRAREELAAWRVRLRLVESLGAGIERPWLADGRASGFEFVALRTVEDFIAESEALGNCLDQYGDQLDSGLTAIFSIRRAGRRVACVEIGLHEQEATMPRIVQLRAARNRRAAPELWQATFAWLGSQRLAPLWPERHLPRLPRRAEARRKLWGPYLAFLADTVHEPAFRRAIVARGRRGLCALDRTLLAPERIAEPGEGGDAASAAAAHTPSIA